MNRKQVELVYTLMLGNEATIFKNDFVLGMTTKPESSDVFLSLRQDRTKILKYLKNNTIKNKNVSGGIVNIVKK